MTDEQYEQDMIIFFMYLMDGNKRHIEIYAYWDEDFKTLTVEDPMFRSINVLDMEESGIIDTVWRQMPGVPHTVIIEAVANDKTNEAAQTYLDMRNL